MNVPSKMDVNAATRLEVNRNITKTYVRKKHISQPKQILADILSCKIAKKRKMTAPFVAKNLRRS